ncbi:MAG: stage II sporulation protein M [Rhodospirillales bacterium]
MGQTVKRASAELKSSAFRKEREHLWLELDGLVTRIEKKGLRKLTAEETLKLPMLYRQTLSSLSVARATSLDAAVLSYLEVLSTRAYLAIYGVNTGFVASLWHLLWHSLPTAMRQGAAHVSVAGAIFALGALVSYALVVGNPDWFYSFVSPEMAGGRAPTTSDTDLRAVIYDNAELQIGNLQFFTSFLFSHNAGIALLAFALGFAFGIPTMLLLFYNGCTVGAFMALYASRGMAVDLGGWLTIHGTTEILAILICGGGGLMLGQAAAFPGRLSRLDNLAAAGRTAARMLVVAIIMLFVAAILEGFGRQLIQDMSARYGIGLIMLTLWMVWFLTGGRRGRR